MTLVIAEIGVNHNGSEESAYKLVDAAIDAGADVAKFQLFKPEHQREHLSWLAFSREQIKAMEGYCKGRGIKFACTAFDADSLEWLLKNTEMAFVKVASRNFNQWVVETLIKAPIIPLVISLGGCKGGLIPHIKKSLPKYDINFLHCVSEYPTPPEHASLVRIVRNQDVYQGLSDHSGDIFMPLAAVALGARIIECHITLDKNQEGPDHKASLTPEQFKEMVRGIRAIEMGLT